MATLCNYTNSGGSSDSQSSKLIKSINILNNKMLCIYIDSEDFSQCKEIEEEIIR